MNNETLRRHPTGRALTLLVVLVLALAIAGLALTYLRGGANVPKAAERAEITYQAREPLDTGGFSLLVESVTPWNPDASLAELRDAWFKPGYRAAEAIDRNIAETRPANDALIPLLIKKAQFLHSEGDVEQAGKTIEQARKLAEAHGALAAQWLYPLIYFQGITSLRHGENENCIMCRGESACIFPIAAAATHTLPEGSRMAIKHFTDYLARFPDDLEVRWLLNLAHMTLGEYPGKVDSRYLISLEKFNTSEFDIGKFQEIGVTAGVNLFNQAGGAVMEDFDNDGLLDLAVTSMDPCRPMKLLRNKGDGTFEDRSDSAGVSGQLGGLYCVQTDYNNDGFIDIYIPRGAWLKQGMRPTLLRNNGDGGFTDVTKEAGLLDPVNSNSACWADYDNDGYLDLFVCCEAQANRLYHNKGDGTFEEVAAKAGVAAPGMCKGATWVDIDNDDDPDLFLNFLSGSAKLYRNDGGKFIDVTEPSGIYGPEKGFSCWAWDYDNDGWLDIFATSYDRTLADVVKGIIGVPHDRKSSKLFRNLKGEGFTDKAREAGLDAVYATMGSNYADFDNDGYLDMYLSTGDPNLSTLVPKRMFKNVAGSRFAEITASTRTGHLQKGHAVACGDWDNDGDIDLFVQLGGAVNGDKYHDVLFDNPGQGNHWLTLKLVGEKTNRAAIGARIKAVTVSEKPRTIHRHVSSGSSFGANPLRQTLGLGKDTRLATLEIHWPTSNTTQVFRDLPVDRAIEITEFADSYRTLDRKIVPHKNP